MKDVGISSDQGTLKAAGRFAVIFKAYRWNDFVCRQAMRCAAGVAQQDFYISLDETSGPIGPVPFANRVSITCEQLIAAGYANRAAKGSLLWWNPDYTHYDFRRRHPGYAYYLFIEHDAAIQGDLAALMHEVAFANADLVTKAIPNIDEWCWAAPHTAVYTPAQLRGSLIAVSIFSARALDMLAERRLEMSADPHLPYWPSAEAFIPTEIERAGYRHLPFSSFGGVQHLTWRPPLLESELPPAATTPQFLHPVLDTQQYLAWAIAEYLTWPRLLLPNSKYYRQVRQFKRADVLRSFVRYGIASCLPSKQARGHAPLRGMPPHATPSQISMNGHTAS